MLWLRLLSMLGRRLMHAEASPRACKDLAVVVAGLWSSSVTDLRRPSGSGGETAAAAAEGDSGVALQLKRAGSSVAAEHAFRLPASPRSL
mmetsp:Transcript_163172/g.396566  ORF Transcript_163172/g.396566 Transcript_163172/m.396566 type:complete len:90 (-) Transcript_163172:1381-1650(-)